MKIKYFQKLDVKLSLLPLAMVVAIFVAGGALVYFYGPHYFLKVLFGPYMTDLMSEKRLFADSLFEHRIKDIEELSKAGAILDNQAVMDSEKYGSGQDIKNKKVRRAVDAAQQKTAALLAEKVTSGEYRTLAILSPGGRIISSYKREMEGEDWSDRDIFKKGLVHGLKAVTMTGFNNSEGPAGAEFLAPVSGPDGALKAVLYSVSDSKDLSILLRSAGGSYKTGKIEVIDGRGNVLLAKDGIPAQKIKYNVPARGGGWKTGLRDRFFFCIADLRHVPFSLIYTADKNEVAGPLNALLIACFSLGGLMMLVLAAQRAYASRLIARPVSRLAKAVRAAAVNEPDIDLGRGYKGELLELKREFESLVESLKGRESLQKEDAETELKVQLKAAVLSNISHETRLSLLSAIKNMEMVLAGGSIGEKDNKALSGALGSARNILGLMDDLLDLSRLEQGKVAVIPEEFDISALAVEVEKTARELIGLKEIEFIIDCQETLAGKPVYTDRQRLKQILAGLAANAVKSTDVGTVTVLLSEVVREGIEYLEVSVADAGKGIAPEITEERLDEFSLRPSFLWFVIAKKLTGMLGGVLEIEKTGSDGSVLTVTIPMKARIY